MNGQILPGQSLAMRSLLCDSVALESTMTNRSVFISYWLRVRLGERVWSNMRQKFTKTTLMADDLLTRPYRTEADPGLADGGGQEFFLVFFLLKQKRKKGKEKRTFFGVK